MNPSGQPFPSQFGGAPPPPGQGGAAREALNVPGILFMVAGCLLVLYSLVNLATGAMNKELVQQVLANPDFPPEVRNFVKTALGPILTMVILLRAIVGGVLVFGGYQMRNLKGYGLAMATCIVALVPCQCCCFLTLPLGVWTLTIITRPEIKSAFT